ncbi:hypothetical protein KM92DES2_20484 [uncultured Desulfovibrio sp.]|uniref:Uncharacterized protein n=1 Tax=uncultured Desulfovibrio sp. TaxID=167968 RepID=A0A212KL31_9BACT|nr:hypothetical protein KM92DES2_20484 [uncultured Desulfovibrio sp.]
MSGVAPVVQMGATSATTISKRQYRTMGGNALVGLGLFFAEQALKGGGIKRRKVETHTRFVQKGRQALAGMQGALFRQIGRSLTHKFALRHNGCHGDILFYSPIAVVPSFGNALPAGRHIPH